MRLRTRSAPGLLAFALTAALGALPAQAGDPSRNLDELEPATSRDVDEVSDGKSEDSDDLLGTSDEEDVVDSSAPDASGRSYEGETADSESLDDAEASSGWSPPPCDEVSLDLGAHPAPTDADAWRGVLQDAQTAIGKARDRLTGANAEYTYARNRRAPRGEALAEIIAERDKARVDLGKALCTLPARVAQAKRLGVPAEAWRDYPASID